MGIFSILSNKKDRRSNNDSCTFNGLLKEYLPYFSGSYKIEKLFADLIEHDPDIRVIYKLAITVSKDSISNDIIGYKDIFKFNQRPLVVPYILYGKKDGVEKAAIVDKYIYAKGEYFSLTEYGSEFQDYKNDIIAVGNDRLPLLIESYDKLFVEKAGKIQRWLDKQYYSSFDASYADALDIAEVLRTNAFDVIDEMQREPYIKNHIRQWFLLKKYVYVQYMTDKSILQKNHNGNIKEQRKKAKQLADGIKFISLSELWEGRQTVKNAYD